MQHGQHDICRLCYSFSMSTPRTAQNKPPYLKDVLLLFAVPIGTILIVAAMVYLPTLFARPGYDFIYSYCADYVCKEVYNVDSSKHLTVQSRNLGYNTSDASERLSYYSAKTNATHTLTLDEAKQYVLDTSSKSPDGYSLSKNQNQTGFLFWSSTDNDWYLKDGAKKKRIDLVPNSSYYSNQITFLGWVMK